MSDSRYDWHLHTSLTWRYQSLSPYTATVWVILDMTDIYTPPWHDVINLSPYTASVWVILDMTDIYTPP